MLFNEALEELKNGKYVLRDSWEEKDGYIVFMPGMTHCWKIMPHPNPNAGNHIFSMEEMCAEDWKIKL